MILRATARIASQSRLHAYATGKRDAESGLAECLRHEANSEHGFLGLVQQFHVPFAVLLQAAGNAAKQVAAHLGMSQCQRRVSRSSGAVPERLPIAQVRI